MNPRVTVLMLTFNRPQFISRAVESIRRQTLQDWELIVVHDGPNEEIAAILGEWERKEPRVRYFRRLEKGNIAQANNYGLQRAQGRYVAVLDDDDYWSEPDKLEKQVRFLEENPEYVACGGGAITIDPQGRELLRYLKPETPEEIEKVALVANPMVHSTTMYRLESARQVGFYDESLAGFQDWDLFLKLGRAGKLRNFPVHWLYYQIWEGGGSFQAQRGNTQSAVRIVRRHGTHYRGYPVALTMAVMYYLYARLPVGIKKITFSSLSRLKKAFFSVRKAADGSESSV